MKFTFWAVGAPLGTAIVLWILDLVLGKTGIFSLLSVPLVIWFFGGCCCILPYWFVRLARRAWGDGSPKQPARPAGWIYPDQR